MNSSTKVRKRVRVRIFRSTVPRLPPPDPDLPPDHLRPNTTGEDHTFAVGTSATAVTVETRTGEGEEEDRQEKKHSRGPWIHETLRHRRCVPLLLSGVAIG